MLIGSLDVPLRLPALGTFPHLAAVVNICNDTLFRPDLASAAYADDMLPGQHFCRLHKIGIGKKREHIVFNHIPVQLPLVRSQAGIERIGITYIAYILKSGQTFIGKDGGGEPVIRQQIVKPGLPALTAAHKCKLSFGKRSRRSGLGIFFNPGIGPLEMVFRGAQPVFQAELIFYGKKEHSAGLHKAFEPCQEVVKRCFRMAENRGIFQNTHHNDIVKPLSVIPSEYIITVNAKVCFIFASCPDDFCAILTQFNGCDMGRLFTEQAGERPHPRPYLKYGAALAEGIPVK